MPLPRSVSGGLLAFLLMSCGGRQGPEDAQRYVAAMTPVVQANADLSRRYLALTERLRKHTADSEAIATALDAELLPAARQITAAARQVAPAEEYLSLHLHAVDAWTRRAEAYSDLSRAWHTDSVSLFDAAMRANLKAHEDEEQYFSELNALLATHGLRLDPLPAGS